MLDKQQEKQIFNKIKYPTITEEIIEQILDAIRGNVFKPGDQLPSEPVLADQFNVSRNTLREALNSLVDQGIIYRQRGIGTFISPQSKALLTADLINMVGTSSMIKAQKKIPGQHKFSFQIELPPKKVSEGLQLSRTTEVMHISRVRTADGVPVIMSDEYFPCKVQGMDYDLGKYSQLPNWSIYDHFIQAGYDFQYAIVNIHAVSADFTMADNLDVAVGTPLLSLEQAHYSHAYEKPLLFCLNIHNDRIMNLLMMRSV